MLSYKELLKPSVVTHCAIIPKAFDLHTPNGNDVQDLLVVVRGDSLLQCFRGLSTDGKPRDLIWVSECELQGTVQQMVWIGDKRLAVTFSSAKLVELSWNMTRLCFEPESLHLYEQHRSGEKTEHKLMLDPFDKVLSLWVRPDLLSVLHFYLKPSNLLDTIKKPADQTLSTGQSRVSLMDELTTAAHVSEIVDISIMPHLKEPAYAVLAWSQPSWAGLIGAQSPKTKVLVNIVAQRLSPQNQNAPPALKMAELPYDVSRVFPILDVHDRYMLLVGSRSLYILDAANFVYTVDAEIATADAQHVDTQDDVKKDDVKPDYGYDFANAQVAQLGKTQYFLIVLQSGDALLVNVHSMKIVQHVKKWLKGGSPTTLLVSGQYIVAGSRDGNAQVSIWNGGSAPEVLSTRSQSKSAHNIDVSADTDDNTLLDIMNRASSRPLIDEYVLPTTTVVHELINYGPFSAVATIADGLACSTNTGIVIVERELMLTETNSALLDRDLEPGSFWLPHSASSHRPLLVSSYIEIDNVSDEENGENTDHDKEGASAASKKDSKKDADLDHDDARRGSETGRSEPATPKRLRTTEPATVKERAVTEISELFHASKSQRQTPVVLPRGVSRDQNTLAVYESDSKIWIVQRETITVLESHTWRPLRSVSIQACDFADISKTKIMTYTSAHGRCNLYSPDTLELEANFKVDKQDTATISSRMLVSSQGSIIRIQEFNASVSARYYDVSNFDEFVMPETSASIKQKVLKDPAYLSLYALQFNETDYVGIHIDRLFAVYESVNNTLVKRFTMPFAVNQSPIFLPNIEALVFPGKKAHILVKGQQSAFQYHRLSLYGDKLIDVVSFSNDEFAWLDDKETLHFSRIGTSLEYHSFSLPLRFIPLDVERAAIKTVAYHDDSASVVLGINVETDFVEDAVNHDGAEEVNGEEAAGHEMETGDMDIDSPKPFIEEAEDASGETEKEVVAEIDAAHITKMEPPAPTYRGQVRLLSLETYEFQTEPLVEYEEAVVSMCMVDFDEPKCSEILAVGTAGLTVESSETNGHLYLYKFVETSSLDTGETKDLTDAKHANDGAKADHTAENDRDNEAEDSPLVSLKLYVEEHLRGAVSSMSTIMRYLAVAHGNQIHIYNIHGHKKIDPIAFLNTDVYVQDMKVARNIIGLGEKLRAPRLLNFSTTPHRTDILANADPNSHQETVSIEFVSSAARGDLTLVCAGADRRLQVFQFDPENPDSNGGSRLVPISDFYSGRKCNSMCAAQVYNNNDLICYGVASDGTLLTIHPLNEEMYRTFYILVHQMMEREEGQAGLNPKMYRASPVWGPNNRNKMLDLNYACRFWNLSLEQQAAYGRILGFQGLNRAHRALSVEGRDLLKL